MLAASPGVAPRLSVETPFRRCAEQVPAGGTVVSARCPAPRGADKNPAAVAGLDPRSDDPRTIQMLALLELVANDPRGIRLDRSITLLRRAAELADNPAPALVDLSAALIVRAERTQAPRDLLEAYETAQKAADHEPHNPAALYNRALALDRFGLVEETAEDWKLAIAADAKSDWADEAKRRLDALQAIHAPIPPRDDAPLADYARYAAEEPQGARELGMDKLLAQWGEAVHRGDTARAADRLRRAEALGTALLRRPGGDASLADMVRAIREIAADSAATRRLAEAHAAFGRGRVRFAAADYASAHQLFNDLQTGSVASVPLRQWGQVLSATAGANLLPRQDGMRLLQQAMASLAASPYPAVVARSRWSFATFLSAAERWERGLEEARTSEALFASLGERPSRAAAWNAIADASFMLGEPDAGYDAAHRALGELRSARWSPRLHNLLASFSDVVARDGFVRAAIRFQDEDVRVATGLMLAEAHLRRARLLALVNEAERARTDLEAARPIVAGLERSYARAWLTADMYEADAAISLRASPRQSAQSFDSAYAFFSKIHLPFRFLPELVGAAEARLASGDRNGATIGFDSVIGYLEQRRASIRMEPRRAAVFDAAQTVVNRLVMLELSEGRQARALEYLDRARASLAPAGLLTPGRRRARPETRHGEVALEYALVADTLLTWAVSGTTVHVVRSTVDTLKLIRTISELGSRLERGASVADVRGALMQLYDWLVRPFGEHLGAPDTRLAIVADGILATVPFAALYDSTRHRYLVEDHPLRFAVSLREAEQQRPTSRTGPALFVADPAFDPRDQPLLDRLPHALREVHEVSRLYPRPIVLEGSSATADAFTAALSHAAVAHFAGHAVFDDARPERSYLVLAPSGSSQRTGRVTAAELARLDLPRTRLVVLAACRTVRGGRSRAAGYSGLSGALLTAGVGGIVGTTWDVDDRFSAELISAFHAGYRTTGDGIEALRRAQVAQLRAAGQDRRSPAAWAAFRYMGQ